MYFNPRTHVGCDSASRKESIYCLISIHAPTWGATKLTLPMPRQTRHFNPRTHVGCDIPNKSGFDLSHEFQSTHPRGVRPKLLHKLYSLLNFNPRTHVGCDNKITDAHAQLLEFQSTHPRGVRLEALWISANRNLISIHAVIGNFEFPNFRKVNSPI